VTCLDTLVSDAAGLAWRLRDEDPAEVWADLYAMAAADPLRLVQTTCMLAAMVDVDRTVPELLAWTSGGWTDPDRLGQLALHIRACRNCSTVFLTVRANRQYCTQVCREAARRRQWRTSKQRAKGVA